MERLQRYLARAGVASRRTAEELIAAGRVVVNGEIVTVMGAKVEPGRDLVELDGCRITPPVTLTYVMQHKPAGYVTTMRDPQGRPRVIDLLPPGPRLYPVGRLDLETTGLLILTNDGELAQLLLHPRYGVWKTYLAQVKGVPSPATLARLARGIVLEDGPTAPAAVKIVSAQDGYATLEVKLHEGRKRQVRRMLGQVGHPVVALSRIAFGPLRLGNLPEGACRPLTASEIEALRAAVSKSSTPD